MLKITGGLYRGRKIITTRGEGYRPATARVRESLFSMLRSLGFFGGEEIVLDVFAGSGVLGFEALSRGALQVYFLEKMRQACACIQKNCLELQLDASKTKVICKDALKALETQLTGLQFDLIFVDPPYGKNYLTKTLQLILTGSLLSRNGVLVAEVESTFQAEEDLLGLNLYKQKLFGQTKVLIWTR
ncbi:MAG: 16S rRNA (guanine(966)-N(2))-methyltransferase RsmD [Desulfonauticus sp.]|nr:16S rRNA (guanine(966)-N(2))-methyltransferase RsmD [Desulfonauticus sp.]